MTQDGLEIVYDGECPVCSAYMRMARLRAAAGPVALIDARSGDPRVAALERAGHDLDAGMVVRWRGRVYHGAEAMAVLATLSDGPAAWQALQRAVFGRPRVARIVYPALVRGRLALPRLLGRGRIRPSRATRRE